MSLSSYLHANVEQKICSMCVDETTNKLYVCRTILSGKSA